MVAKEGSLNLPDRVGVSPEQRDSGPVMASPQGTPKKTKPKAEVPSGSANLRYNMFGVLVSPVPEATSAQTKPMDQDPSASDAGHGSAHICPASEYAALVAGQK